MIIGVIRRVYIVFEIKKTRAAFPARSPHQPRRDLNPLLVCRNAGIPSVTHRMAQEGRQIHLRYGIIVPCHERASRGAYGLDRGNARNGGDWMEFMMIGCRESGRPCFGLDNYAVKIVKTNNQC